MPGSNGPQLFTIEQWGTPDKLPRAHTWYVTTRTHIPEKVFLKSQWLWPHFWIAVFVICQNVFPRFPVSTAWICQPMNPLRTWERNSSWPWRTHRASRGLTKTANPLSASNQPTILKKHTKQNKKPQGCQTSCCSSSVRACCTVMPDCEPPWQHGGFKTVQRPVEPICLRLYNFSVCIGHSLKVLGAGERKGESHCLFYPQAWTMNESWPWYCTFLSPLPSSCENLQCWKNTNAFQ